MIADFIASIISTMPQRVAARKKLSNTQYNKGQLLNVLQVYRIHTEEMRTEFIRADISA